MDLISRPEEILKELNRLHELINRNKKLVEENLSEFALQLNLMSLEAHETLLLEELKETNRQIILEYNKIISHLCKEIKTDGNNEENLRKILCYLDFMNQIVLEEYMKYF